MLDAVALELMAVRPDLTSAWGGIEVASDGHPAHFYFYDFCIDSARSLLPLVHVQHSHCQKIYTGSISERWIRATG